MVGSLSRDDVERLLAAPSAEHRAETAAKVAADFGTRVLSASERKLAEDIFRRLARDAELSVREALAANLKENPDVPPDVARRLAADVDSVALPVLQFSAVLSEEDLIAIVRENESGSVLEAVVWLDTGLAVIPSAYLWGLAARRWGLRPAFAIGCAVEGVGVMASVALGGMTGPLLGGILLGNTFVAITALGIQIGRNLAGPSPRKILSVMTAAFGLGQIVGPVVAGIVADWTGGFFWPSVLAALALAVSAWLAVSSKVATSRRRRSSTSMSIPKPPR